MTFEFLSPLMGDRSTTIANDADEIRYIRTLYFFSFMKN